MDILALLDRTLTALHPNEGGDIIVESFDPKWEFALEGATLEYDYDHALEEIRKYGEISTNDQRWLDACKKFGRRWPEVPLLMWNVEYDKNATHLNIGYTIEHLEAMLTHKYEWVRAHAKYLKEVWLPKFGETEQDCDQ